ncbi:sulfite exporter TauE/SafE family protein [Allopusillimonas soli]|uniref:Probable membrane transporter protein n=1 Tax=Allopusillimonas soli TaxID=659016 RepID=A0A853F970_9BURK|nr:sulfite exporter TauE/SafE family protein [Allopusillimonas soli]NYT35490.1 sulfite exporter TauE/SafE family protein [Allopusillimonas soli]TEA75902.1 sulfite exporter TauE/SafE family protein [Allopusillimonas soli]
MTTTLFIELFALGLASGFLAGLLGIGGGMFMVPIITFLLSGAGVGDNVAVKIAIATSMAVIVFTSISSVRAHHKRGAVRWDIVAKLAPGIIIGSLIGSVGVFSVLKGVYLAIFFGIFVAFSATQMFLNKKPSPSREMPGTAGQLAAGGIIGFLSGLVGAGGGFISVPFMTWCNIAIHTAVATSAGLGFPIAVSNVLGYVISGSSATGLPPGSFGYIWLPALGCIAVGSVLTAPLGAKAAHRLPVGTLKRVFACLLYVLAVYMLWKGFSH